MTTKNREKEIIKCSAKIFREKGYYGTSIQKIAETVGLKKGSLYHYINSKQSLLFQILNEGINSVSEPLEKIFAMEISPKEKLKLAVRNHIIKLIEHIDHVTVFLQERNSLSPDLHKEYREKRKRYEAIFRCIIEEGITKGEFPKIGAQIATFAILGMCNWISQWYSSQGRLSPEEISDGIVDLVERMLKNNFEENEDD